MLEFDEIKCLFNVCYQCGTCVSTCAAGMVNPAKNIRRLVQNMVHTRDAIPAEENDLLWLCTTCYQCEDRCPEGVPLTSLLIELKNMAAAKGMLPASIQREIETLTDHGFTYPPLKSIVSRRRRLGLPELPRPDQAEIRTLINLARPHDKSPNSGGRSA